MVQSDMQTQTLSTDIPDATPDVPKKTSDASRVCTTTCKYDGKTTAAARTAGHVSCSLCLHTYHKDCISYPKDILNVWPCPSCRQMPAEVKGLNEKLDLLLTQNKSLTDMVTQQEVIIRQLTSLETKVAALSSKLVSDTDDPDDEEDEPEDAEPTGDLLIGDSLIRDVIPSHESLTVDSQGGATLNNIRKKIKAIKPKKRKYERIIIVAGTNDTTSKRPPEKIAADLKTTIQAAKLVAPIVIMSSIPPRADNKVDDTKIDTVNQLFLTVTQEEDATFINNDNNFRFRDNSIDTGLLLTDQLHLSKNGISKLLSNLGLATKAKSRLNNKPPSAQWNDQQKQHMSPMATPTPPPLMSSPSHPADTPSPVLFRGGGSPLSNFFPAPITIWDKNFQTSEHAYQYHKCMTMSDNTAASNVLRAHTPLDAKRIGDAVSTNPKWNNQKQGVMCDILKIKAQQSSQFRHFLENSGDRPLVEDTVDQYWGRGRDGRGLNMLGRLLMTLRSELSYQESRQRNYTPRPMVTPHRNDQGHSVPHSRQQQLRCFNCGEASHNKSTCRLSAPLRCYSCNGLGHKRKFCRHNY